MIAPDVDAPWWHHAFFSQVVSGNSLGPAAFLISAHAGGPMRALSDLDRCSLRLDALAENCERSFFGWHRRLFVELGFSGNGSNYHDPKNSFLPYVIERRVGIPISLAVVAIEVGVRMGVPTWGVGMPGHFLIGAPIDPLATTTTGVLESRFIDAFHGGRILDVSACSDLYGDMFGGRPLIPDQDLAPTPVLMILMRMCANLKSIYARARDIDGLTAMMRLRSCLPGMSLDEGRELVRLLDATGSWSQARSALDQLQGLFPSPKAQAILDEEHLRLAQRLN